MGRGKPSPYDFAETANHIMTTNGDKIGPGLRIIVSF